MSNTGKSYGKKIVFAVITLALLCYLALAASAVGSVSEFVENAEAAWDNTAATSFASGDGSLSDPYVIKTAQQLAYFRNQVNAGNTYSGKYIVLGANIDLISASGAKQGFGTISEVTGHSSSGFSGTTFQGTFDGRYYEIKNLYWNGANYRGLFGHIGSNGKVLNLTVSSVELISSGILNGTIAVVNEGTIDNCVVASGSIKSAGTAGGIAAYVGGGTITRCINYADVLPNGNAAVTSALPGQNDARWPGRESGGVAGVVVKNSTIDQCAFYGVIRSASALGTAGGDRTGGIVGALDNSTLTNSYFIGEMYNTLDSTSQGGLTGEFYSPVTVRNSYYQVTGGAVASALGWQQNQNESATQSGIYTSGSAASGALTSGAWTVSSSKHGGYPYLKDTRLFDSYNISAADMGLTPGEVAAGYSNTSGTQLTTSNYLGSFRNAGNVSGNFYLTSDLTMTMNYNMSSYTCNFSGVLDGNGHTITLTLDGNWREIVSGSNPYNGILCSALSGGTIKNLNIVVNASTLQTANNNCDGNAAAGVIAGNSTGGTIDNCNITINNLCLWGLSGNNGELALGGIFGFVGKNASGGTTTISNTEVNVNGNFKLQRQNSGGWSWISPMVGGLYGSHTLNITDSKVNVASGANVNYLTSGDTSSVSGCSGHYGGFVGETMSNCTLNISNSFYDFDGNYSSAKSGGTNGKIIGANQASVTASLQNIYYDTGTSEASVVYNANGGSLDTTGCKRVSAFDNGSVALSGLFIDPKTPGMLYMQYTVETGMSYIRFGNSSDMDGVILSGGVSGMHVIRLSSALLQNATSGWQKNGGTLKDPWTDQTNEVSGLASGIIPAMQGINLNAGTQIGAWQGGTSISGFSSIPVQIYNSSGTLVWDSADGGDKAVSSVNGHLLPGTYYARFAYSPVYGGFFGSSGYAYNEYKKFIITKRDVAVSVADRSSVYGDLNVSSLSATANGVYTGGTQDSFNYTVTNGVTELRLNITISVNFGAARPTVGNYTITVNVAEVNSGFYNLTVTNGTYAITERPVAVEIDNKEKIYGENDPQFTYSASGVLEGDTLNITIDRNDPDANRNVGKYAINGTDNDTNYAVTFTQGTLDIQKRPVNVTVNDYSKFYGEANPALSGWVYGETQPSPVGGMAYGEKAEDVITVRVECAATKMSPVGNYDITGTATSENYSVTVEKGVLTIDPRPILITPDEGQGHIYGDVGTAALTYIPSNNDASLTDNAIVTGDTLTGALGRGEGSDARSYAINLGTLTSENNSNYEITLASTTVYYVISPRPLHYVLSVKNMSGNATDGYSLEYGAFSATANLGVSIVSGEGYYAVVAGESVTVTPKLPDGGVKNVGTYTIDAIDAAYGETTSADNYEIKLDNTVSFKIVAKAVTVDISSYTKTYGEANPVFQWSLAAGSAMAYGEDKTVLDVTLSLSGDGVAVGGYTINGAWNNTNYAVTFNEGTLTVTSRAITVTLKQDFSSVYGESLAEVTVATALTLAEGTLAPTIPAHSDLEAAGFSISFNDNISDAGVYGGYISASCDNTNYAVTWTDGKQSADYTVTARPVKYTITLIEMGDDYSLIYGEFVESTHVTVSGPVTEAGFYDVLSGDSITVTPFYTYTSPGGTQTLADISAEVKNVGTYTVTGNVVYNGNTLESNYAVTVEVEAPGRFFIEKRPVEIILSSQTKTYGDDDPATLGKWSVSGSQPEGGGIVYGEDPHAVITVTDVSYGDVKDADTYTLTAKAESANYTVTVVDGSMEIKAKEVTVTITSAEKTYGEPDPAFEWSHTELAYGELAGVLGFTVTREEGEDVKEGGYALSGKATNANYSVTVAKGSVLTINPLEISFTVTPAQLPYNMYTAETLPEPAMLGASATPSPTTLPYGDTVTVTFTYTTDASTIVNALKGEYAYIDTAITFRKSDGTTSAAGNYTVAGTVECKLVVVSGDLIINLDAYSKTYDFAAGGITLSLSSVKVTVASGAAVTPVISAKILSSDGLTEYFVSADGKVIISYVPSSVKEETSVNLKFVVTAEAAGYEPGEAEMTITLNKESYDLGITFEDKVIGYDGKAHEIGYKGELPKGLTAEVTHTGDNVNYTANGATFTLTIDLTGEEHDEIIYYSYNLPAARTALLTINKAPVKITVNPQSSVYDGKTPEASATQDKDYTVEGNVYTQGGVLDDLGVKLTVNRGAQAVDAGEYELSVSITNTNYELTAVTGTYTVTQRPVYVQLTSAYASKVYGDGDPDWSQVSLAVEPYDTGESGTGLVGGDGLNALNIESVTREKGEAVLEGGYAVTVSCAEGGNYYVDESYLRAFNIDPRPLTVILNKDAFVSVYGEALVRPNAADTAQLALKEGFELVGEEAGKSLAEAGFSLVFTDNFGGSAGGIVGASYTAVGVYREAVRLSFNNDNYSVTFEGGFVADYTVTKRPVWITVTPVTVEYGDNEELSFEVNDDVQPAKGGLATGEAADDIGITLTREGGDRPDVGKYNIDCIVGETSNYEVSVMNSPEVVYEVTAREIKIIINDAEKTYGDETPEFEWKIADGDSMAYDDDVTALGIALTLKDGAEGVDAGEYTITGTSSAGTNYLVIFENATFTVHKKQAVIDASGVVTEYVYTGGSFWITEGATHNNTDVESETSQLKYPDKKFLNVSDSGEYKITIGATKNFLAAEATITVTIAKATIVFDWSGVKGEYVYNGSEQTVTGVKVNVDGAAVEYANNTFTDVPEGGVLNVTVSVAETENIIGASETRAIPVLRATIDMSDVSFDSAEYIFDATEKALTVSGTLPWGIEGVKYAGNALTEVGTTEAVAEFVYNANNFNAVENRTATLTITPRPVAIEITSASKVYGDEDPAYTFALAADQPCEGTDKVLAMWALNAVVARDQGEDAGEYALTLTGYDRNYSVTIVSEGKLTVIPRDIVFAVTGVFESVYDGNEKEVTVDEALTVASGSLAPVHADIAASGAVSVSFAEGVSITNAGLYENAVIFTLIGGNYAATFEGTTENVVTADYTVTRREITVKLRDQRLLKEESIDSKAYDVTAGTLVKGDDLGITISAGAELDVDRYELVAEYTNLNYAVAFESGVLVYTVRAIITAVTPADFLYTGEPFAIDVTINSTAPLVFYINGEYSANRFVEPGHYVVTISASADDTYREPLAVTVVFNILAPEIKHEADGAEISVSTDTGFYPEDSFDIIREQGRENSTIAEMISGEYTIVDGYVLNVSTEGGTVTLGEYIRNNAAGEDLVVRIKVPEEYANSATVECVIIRSGEANIETVEVNGGYIEVSAQDVEAVAFIAERETLIAVVIVVAVFAIAMLLLGCFYVFRKKAY